MARLALPAPGSLAAQDAHKDAFVSWRLAQSASDLCWTNAEEAQRTELAREDLIRHAINCGWDADSGADLIKWSAARVRCWGRACGVSEMEIAVVLGGEA